VPVVAAVSMGLVFLVVMGAIFWWAHLQAKERREVWQRVAARRGGRYLERRWSLLGAQSEAIEARVGHAIVRLDLYVVSSGKSSTTYTRARARFALGAGPRFRVYEEGFFSSLGKALGTQDLELGDPRFDAIFMVKGDDVEALRRAWTEPARHLLMSRFRHGRAESNGHEVSLIVLGALLDVATLEAMLDLVGELASAGARELEALAKVPDATLEPTGGSWEAPTPPRLRIATPHGEAVAELRPGAPKPRLLLTLPSRRELPRFSVDVAGGEAEGLPQGVLTERALGLLGGVEGAALSGDGSQLRLGWRDVPPPEAVAAGAALLAELAGGTRSVGAFR
jgi:hypothetical protein